MSYIVLARKWRPLLFDDLVGQEHVSRTLRNAIRFDRLAHAYLFTGVRGVGKTSAARILAMALNCEKSDGPTEEPCGKCTACTRITNATSIDVQEIDGASNNSVEDVRHLRETVAFQPAHSRFKVYIIDEVHMLSQSAFNALLKTLEEPPPHVMFIFATTEPHRIPGTILSRCQRYDFRRISPTRIAEHIMKILESESITMDPEATAMIAREAQGSMRDALSLLDQIIAAFGNEARLQDVSWLIGVADHRVHADLTRAVLARDPSTCLEIIGRLDRDGYNLPHFMTSYMEHVRDLIVVKSAGADAPGAGIPTWESEELTAMVRDTPLPELYRIFSHVSRAADEVARSPMPRILLETTFLKLSQNEPLTSIARLLQALGDIKRQGGLPPAKARPGPERTGNPSPQAPAPDVETSATSGPEAWARIVKEAGAAKPILRKILDSATPVSVEPGKVVIGFDAQSEFGSSLAGERASLTAIETACETVLGTRSRVIIESNSQEANEVRTSRMRRKRKQQQERRENALVHPVVREAKDIFDAEIRDIKTDVE